jgi:hypothetical protein
MIYGVVAQVPFTAPPPIIPLSRLPAAASLNLTTAAPTRIVFNPSPNIVPAAGFVLLVGQTASLFDAATTAWINAVVAGGGTVSTARKVVVNSLITGLKTDGLWTKLDRLWVLAAENSQSALIDLKATATATLGSPNPTFAVDRGFTGTGSSSSVIDTGFNGASGTPLLSLNDTHFSLWNLTNPLPTSATVGYCGADPGLGGGGAYWIYFTGDSSFYFRTNDNGAATALASAFTTHAGHFISSRVNSTQRKLYQNGTLKFTTTATSNALPNITHKIISSGLVHQAAAYSVGTNLDGGSDAVNFYTRLQTYMLAIGAPINSFSPSPAAKALNLSGVAPLLNPTPSLATIGTLTGNASATTATLTMPASLVNGNILVGFIQLPAAGGKTFSVGGGWTIGDTDAAGNSAWAWRYVDGSQAAPVFSWGGASVAWHGQVAQIQTVKVTGAIGASTKANGTVSPIAVGAVTTTAARSLILAILLKAGSEVITVPTGFTSIAQFNDSTASDRLAVETVVASGAASDAVSVAITNAVWQGFLIEIKSL